MPLSHAACRLGGPTLLAFSALSDPGPSTLGRAPGQPPCRTRSRRPAAYHLFRNTERSCLHQQRSLAHRQPQQPTQAELQSGHWTGLRSVPRFASHSRPPFHVKPRGAMALIDIVRHAAHGPALTQARPCTTGYHRQSARGCRTGNWTQSRPSRHSGLDAGVLASASPCAPASPSQRLTLSLADTVHWAVIRRHFRASSNTPVAPAPQLPARPYALPLALPAEPAAPPTGPHATHHQTRPPNAPQPDAPTPTHPNPDSRVSRIRLPTSTSTSPLPTPHHGSPEASGTQPPDRRRPHPASQRHMPTQAAARADTEPPGISTQPSPTPESA